MPDQEPVIATLPAALRQYLETDLPSWLQPRWWASNDEALRLGPGAQIGWFDMFDQEALVQALQARSIKAAFLDVMDPEPLPADHVLWSLDNAHVTMHLSGRSQNRMFERTARRSIGRLA